MSSKSNLDIKRIYLLLNKSDKVKDNLIDLIQRCFDIPILQSTLKNRDSYDESASTYLGFTEIAYQNLSRIFNQLIENRKGKGTLAADDYIKLLNKFGRLILGANNLSPYDITLAAIGAVNNFMDEDMNIKLSDVLSLPNFSNTFNKSNNKANGLKSVFRTVLQNFKNMPYDDIKKEVEASSLSSEDKKKCFAEILLDCNFDIYSSFHDTFNMFKDGYISFDTLVTKVWIQDEFDENDDNFETNAFQKFAYNFKASNSQKIIIDDFKRDTVNMIKALREKGVISDNDVQNLENQIDNAIDNAIDVGVLDIIVQFFSNLFSKGKTAFKPIQQTTKQDRVISSLKPLSGLLREATKINKDIQQK